MEKADHHGVALQMSGTVSGRAVSPVLTPVPTDPQKHLAHTKEKVLLSRRISDSVFHEQSHSVLLQTFLSV